MRRFTLLVFLLSAVVLFGQNPNEDQAGTDEEALRQSGHVFQVFFKNRPSLQIGELANIEIRSKWHFDFRSYDPGVWNPPAIVTALPQTPPTFYLTRARIALKGAVTARIKYEFERDFRETVGSDHEWHPWKDAYVDFNAYRLIQIRAGKFKMPFGMEANLPEDRLDFALKSRTDDILAPGRERGVMLHSTFWKKGRMEYKAGVFRYDGEGSDIHGQPTAGRTYAASLNGEPLRYLKHLPKGLRNTYLGVSVTRGQMIPGLNGVHGATFSRFTYFDHMYVQGERTRVGTEFSWRGGPVGLKGEYMHMSEERKQQGIFGEDLPDEITRGWYLMASWNPLGAMKSSGRPKKPLLRGGFGAVELSARYDVVAFYSAQGPGMPSRSPRAPTILPNGERTWTVGPTWYLNRFAKIQVNGQREHLTDIERKAVFGIDTFWSGIIRLQLAM
ncbi:MAG TPA: porin [Terriglobia bacterium]|nr:porin [Terriglobia bacterium]